MRKIILIAHNLRSTHNVGSLLRTAEGLGVNKVFLTGYTPHPLHSNDERLPHLAKKIDSQINKTALGAQKTLSWEGSEDILPIVNDLKRQGFLVCALEQTDNSLPINKFDLEQNIALIVGREVDGIEPEILKLTDHILEIPMFGQKESFNVVQAAAMALYHLRFF